MDQVSRYRATVRRVLDEFAAWITKPDDSIRCEVVFDPSLDHFELVRFGWDGRRRVHGVLFHLDIIGGKIWVQYDATDRPIAEELVRAGVPKEDIVLGEQPPELRAHTGYGVG
ncbi:MAG: XisI protein [Planctomycetes bacterium]|nr:XisI protein [Planctomycetota bacterium]